MEDICPELLVAEDNHCLASLQGGISDIHIHFARSFWRFQQSYKGLCWHGLLWEYQQITMHVLRWQTDEKVIFIILGDIINSDKNNNNINVPKKYCEAGKFIELLRKKYANSNFLFVPGNHDNGKIDEKFLKSKLERNY